MSKTSQAYSAKRLVMVASILVMLMAPMAFIGVTPVEAAAARVYFAAVSPDKSGYAVDEAVDINVKFKWEGLSANVTVDIQLWNGTVLWEDLGNYTADGIGSTSGTQTVVYTPTVELTNKTSTKTYTLKMLSGGLVTDSASFTIIVAAGQVTMSITWQDQNNDRIVDVNELITFTAYVNWAFVETTEAHSMYVNYGEGETLLSTVSVTAGSGSQTVTDSHGYNTAGAKTATFTLKDATGTTVVARTASLTVGGGATTTPPPPAQTSVVDMVTANWAYIAIAGAVVVIGYLYLGKRKGKGKGK